MPNNINLLSPDFRDFLLNRNLISDTIQNNGLDGLLVGIGIPAEVSHTPEAVQPSTNLEIDGVFYKDLNVVQNKYQTDDNGYRQVSITYLPGDTNSTIAGNPYNHEPYSNEAAEIDEYGNQFRKFNTIKNNYLDVGKQLKIDFGTQPVPTFQLGSYLDENGNLNIGGPSTQALDIIGSVLQGGGIGFDPNRGTVVPDYDVRSSLAGRVLGGAGLINDTRLGQLGSQYLAAALGNNAAFGLQQETIGRLNLNPLSWLQGNDLFVPNYSITVPKSALGSVLDFGAKVLGFEVPVSILDDSASIFGRENPVDNITRLNSMVLNTGKGQVLALIANLNENKYKPTITDNRKRISITRGDTGTNGELYAFNGNEGGIIDLLNTPSSPGTNTNKLLNEDEYTTEADAIGNSGFESSHGRITSELDLPFNSDFDDLTNLNKSFRNSFVDEGRKTEISETGFIWSDNNRNYLGSRENDIYTGTEFTQRKSLLYKTQELFNTNRMKVLTSGKSIQQNRSEINSSVSDTEGLSYMSKGSGVRAYNAGVKVTDSDNMFCRTWTTFDKYNAVHDLQKHSGINPAGRTNPKQDIKASVLEDTGFVKIGPYKDERGLKRFMFSIENLAWADDLTKLIPCEIGNGDLLSGTRGRIMWFPPYDISFNESTSVSWDKSNFIGRGEPIYTYNNAERTGTLSWKIVVDHPNYMNYFPSGWGNDEIASFFAGCLEMESIQEVLVSEEDKAKQEVAENTKPQEVVDDQPPAEVKFSVYFPNDESAVPTKYEDGLDKNNNPVKNPTTEGGQGTTTGGGTVGGGVYTYPDNTNFGLNGLNQKINIGSETVDGWIGNTTQFIPILSEYLKNECKYCKIKIEGFASTQGNQAANTSTNNTNNQKLSLARANSVKGFITSQLLVGDSLGEKRFGEISGAGEISVGDGCSGENGQDRENCKKARKVDVTIFYDPELKEEIEPSPKAINKEETPTIIPINPGIFFTECNYFEKVKEDDPFVYSQFTDKIKNFHPAFHSITPEGFNSRLTFLQQCTRQGPTKIKTGGKLTDADVSNLAFGRPPVCILRIGDFYHTKIIIDNLTIDYEPLVWDLNPEGIGVQPMIASVTINFAFIGGSSLRGPINRLQNAVSFNFFANSEIYDPRAVRISEGKTSAGGFAIGGEIVEGVFPSTDVDSLLSPEKTDGIGNNTNQVTTDQTAEAEKEAANDNTEGDAEQAGTTATTINNVEVSKQIGLKEFYYDGDSFELTLTFGGDSFELAEFDENNKQTGRIKCNIMVTSGQNNISLGSFDITRKSATQNNAGDKTIDTSVKEFIVDISNNQEFNDADDLKSVLGSGSTLKIERTVIGEFAGKSNISFSDSVNTYKGTIN